MPTEADTCRKYVLPKLFAAGWNDDQINEQRTFTDGRIMVTGTKIWRRPQRRADYLLRYRPNLMIAGRPRLPIRIPATGCNRPRNTRRFSISSSPMPPMTTGS